MSATVINKLNLITYYTKQITNTETVTEQESSVPVHGSETILYSSKYNIPAIKEKRTHTHLYMKYVYSYLGYLRWVCPLLVCLCSEKRTIICCLSSLMSCSVCGELLGYRCLDGQTEYKQCLGFCE